MVGVQSNGHELDHRDRSFIEFQVLGRLTMKVLEGN